MLDLLDYRRRIAEMYRGVRESGTGAPEAHARFRRVRDELFHTHPQSPLDAGQRAMFQGLAYFDYDPAFRVVAGVDTGSGTLRLFWIAGYGGGLFLPFGDATNGTQTYGGGRYLYDTIKGADLGGPLTSWSSTLTMPTNHRATTIQSGFALWHRRRASSPFRSL